MLYLASIHPGKVFTPRLARKKRRNFFLLKNLPHTILTAVGVVYYTHWHYPIAPRDEVGDEEDEGIDRCLTAPSV